MVPKATVHVTLFFFTCYVIVYPQNLIFHDVEKIGGKKYIFFFSFFLQKIKNFWSIFSPFFELFLTFFFFSPKTVYWVKKFWEKYNFFFTFFILIKKAKNVKKNYTFPECFLRREIWLCQKKF